MTNPNIPLQPIVDFYNELAGEHNRLRTESETALKEDPDIPTKTPDDYNRYLGGIEVSEEYLSKFGLLLATAARRNGMELVELDGLTQEEAREKYDIPQRPDGAGPLELWAPAQPAPIDLAYLAEHTQPPQGQ